jgi:PIN domain nuclease of toxin-antitoxin system
VTYVTDTHALVFFASGDARRLSPRASRIFRRAEEQRDQVHVPTVCLFEIMLLIERGRIRSRFDLEEWQGLIAAHPGLPIEPLVWGDVREARRLVPLVDPFDRLIAGTAGRLDAPLITGDERIRRSGFGPYDLVIELQSYTPSTNHPPERRSTKHR